jgi:hypothetical protein
VAQQRVPHTDSLAPSPVDWRPILLGVGQEANAYGGNGSFQFTFDGDKFHQTDVRRNPNETFQIISRPPERW